MAHDEVQLCKEAISISRLISVRFIDGKAQDRWQLCWGSINLAPRERLGYSMQTESGRSKCCKMPVKMAAVLHEDGADESLQIHAIPKLLQHFSSATTRALGTCSGCNHRQVNMCDTYDIR